MVEGKRVKRKEEAESFIMAPIVPIGVEPSQLNPLPLQVLSYNIVTNGN
jgi:hypothetical protein